MKKTLLFFLAIIIPVMASAFDAYVNGIYYNFIRYLSSAITAEVTYSGSNNQDSYFGIVNIPSRVSYLGETYSVTSIGSGAFQNCKDLTSITIPNSVTSIKSSAFYGCICLTSVTIPNSVTEIWSSAFAGCSGLTSVTIPNSVTSIGISAFFGCSGLTSVTIPNSVTSIGSSAFEGCSGLTSVTIPNSVTSIGEGVFKGCSGLTSITVASGNNVYDSRSNCNAIIKTTTNELILGCENTVIPNDVAYIVGYAFSGCSGLTSIAIPSSVTGIGDGAFYDCDGLTSITIPNSVTSIRQYAFKDCSGLTSITIGSGVKRIGSRSFSYCSKITDVYCLADNVPSTESDAFEYSNFKNATLHVPESSISNYKYKTPWSSFKNIVSNTTTYTLSISATGNGSASYNSTTVRNKTTTFTVNEGTNATISFSPDNGYRIKTVTVGGTDVTASVTNNRYTVSNIKNNTIVGIEFEAYNTYTPGDVNNDGSVSVTDVGCAINYILEQVPSTFVFDAADMNGDKSVSVTDVGMIINFILSEGAGSRKYGKTMEANHHDYRNNNPNISLVPTAGSNLELKLEDKDAFIGFQFDVEDAEGAGWHGACPYISMQLSDGDDHVLTSRQLSNGKWRVVCYSLSNSSFSPNSGASLLTINTERNVSLSDIRLTTAGFDELRPAAIVSTPTGIASVEQGVKINAEGGKLCIISDRNITLRLYSLGGSAYRTLQVKKGVNSFDGLRPGLYMINNKKIILR